MDGKDEYSSVWVTAKDGVSQDELLSQVEPLVPEGYKESFAQLGEEVKNHISHRARAVKKLADYLMSKQP